MDRYGQQQDQRRHLRPQDIDLTLEQQQHPEPWDHQLQEEEEEDHTRTEAEQLHANAVVSTTEEEAGSTAAETPSTRGTANVRSRVRYWLNDIVDEMRKKSPASVQKWVDSIQMPNSAGSSTIVATADSTATGASTSSNHATTAAAHQPDEPDGTPSDVPGHDQLVADVPFLPATKMNDEDEEGEGEQEEELLHEGNQQARSRRASEESQEWGRHVEQIVHDQDQEEESGGGEADRSTELVLMDSVPVQGTDPNDTLEPMDVIVGCGSTSTPKVAKLEDGPKPGAESSGLSLRNFLSKKSLLGKFSRSGSNLDHSPTGAENAPMIGVPSDTDELGRKVTANESSPSPFLVGKSKINEFYDKLSMNKAKYTLIKAKKLDIRNMLGAVALGREGSGPAKPLVPLPIETRGPAGACESVQGYDPDREAEEPLGEMLPGELERLDDRSSPSQQQQQPEPLEVSVIDVDPSDAYEFSFDDSFPKSDELIPGMISEEDEEKENILDTTASSVASHHHHHHGYGYDAYLNPPKPKTHRIGIGRIGRSSSENPRATARRYNLMEIGRSFSEMNDDDDDSFAISECNNSCPNPSSLNTSSSINEHGSSVSILTRSVPVSPIPRASSKLSIQQEHLGHHATPAQLQQQHSLVEQSSHRRRSTMLVKDSSLQSDSSRCSSVESLLNARKPDPEKILLNLGFGPAAHSTDVLAKIPKRFLKPSQVRGVDTEAFLRQQQLSMHIHENSVLGYRGLVGNPHIPPSMIVAKIMERFQENDSKTRLTAAGVALPQSDSRNSSGPPSPVPMTRHASLATTDGRLKF